MQRVVKCDGSTWTGLETGSSFGGIHTTNTLLAVIGKRFQDAGLKDLGIEVGIITEGSIAAMFHEYLDLLRT